MGLEVKSGDVSAIHYLPSRDNNNTGPKNVVVQFISRKTKDMILRTGKRLKGLDVYINEHLTRKNMALHKKGRELRKSEKIINVWTRNCKVWIKTKHDK